MYSNIQKRLCEVIPLVLIIHATPILGVGERVKNFIPPPTKSDNLAEVTVQ